MAMEEPSLVGAGQVFSRFESEAPIEELQRQPEEYVALLRGRVVGHARSVRALRKRLKMKGINPNKIKIERARVKLIL